MDNKRFKKLRDELSKEVERYKKNGSCNKEQFKKIVSLAYTYIYFFVVDFYKEDDLADDFATYLLSKLEQSVLMWDEKKGLFTNYFTPFISSSFSIYRLNLRTKQKENELVGYLYQSDNDELVCDDKDVCDEFVENNNDNSKTLFSYKYLSNDFKKIMAYTLSYARLISDDMIRNIAKLTNTSELKIKEMIEDVIIADEEMHNKNKRLENEKLQRNRHYLNVLKLENKNAITMLDENEEKLLLKYKRNLESHNTRISHLNLISQKAVAKVLDIEYRSIRGFVHRGKLILEKIAEGLKE